MKKKNSKSWNRGKTNFKKNKKLLFGVFALLILSIGLSLGIFWGVNKENKKPNISTNQNKLAEESKKDEKSKKDEDLIKIEKVKKLFYEFSKNGTRTLHSKVIPSTLKEATTADELGFEDPSVGKDEGTSVTFKSNKIFDLKGTIEVEVSIALKNKTGKIYFILEGFKKDEDLIKIEKVAKLFKELIRHETKTLLSTVTPSTLKESTTADELGFEDPSVGKREGTIVTFRNVKSDDANGNITVNVRISFKDKPKEFYFVLAGFKKDEDLIKIEKVKKLFYEFSKNGTRTSHSKVIPSTLKESTTADELGFEDPSVGKREGTSVTFKSNKIFDLKGTIEVEVSIALKNKTGKIYFILEGFKRDEDLIKIEKVEKIFNEFVNGEQRTIHSETLPSTLKEAKTAKELGFKDPLEGKRENSNVNFSVIEVDDIKGQLVIEATITLGDIVKYYHFVLAGFKKDEDLIKIEKVAEQFKKFISTKPTTTLSSASPSTLNKETTALKLGFTNPLSGMENDTNVKFQVVKSDDVYGYLIIKVTIELNEKYKIITFRLNGFKKDEDWIKIEEVAKLFYEFIDNELETRKSNILPSSLGESPTFGQLGFEDPSFGKKGGVEIEYTFYPHDDAGTLTLMVKITLNGKVKHIPITFDGFQKKPVEP